MHNLALLRRPRTIYRGWWIVLTGLLALIVSGGTTSFIFSVLIKPMEADLGWSRATLVGVLTLGGLVSGVLAASVGPLFDKHGARFMMTAGAVLGGVCFILVSRVSSPWQYYLLLGVGEAITRPALDTVGPRTAIANWFVSKRPAAYAIFTSGRAVAGITLVSPMAWLAMNAGWRMVWVVMGLLELVLVAPLAWASVRKRPEDEGLLPDGVLPDTQPPREATLHEGAGLGTEATEVPWSVSQALHTKSYWALVLGIVLVSFPGASIFIHMSPYFQDKGLSTAGAALLLSVYASGALLGRVVWAFLAARIGIQRSLTTFAVAYGTAIMLFIGASGVVALFTTALMLGLIIGGAGQLQAQVWPDYFGRHIVGSLNGYAAVAATPALAGGPLLAALMYDSTGGYSVVFSFFSALCFAAALCFLVARRPTLPGARAIAGT